MQHRDLRVDHELEALFGERQRIHDLLAEDEDTPVSSPDRVAALLSELANIEVHIAAHQNGSPEGP